MTLPFSGQIITYDGKTPELAKGVFLAGGAVVIGDVVIGKGSSIWFNTVLRGDVNFIRVGENTNIQDGTIIHVTSDGHPTLIGSNVTIGHGAVVHACTIGDNCLIGMNATVLDGAVVEDGAMVAAGALVTPGKRVPGGELWGGNPAKALRPLSPGEIDFMALSAQRYVKFSKIYMDGS